MDDRREEHGDDTLVDHALELFVYAPLGFALEARTLLPRFVDRGRNQIALARVVGKFAVRKGREDVEARLLDGQAQAVGLLRSVGLVPPDADHDAGHDAHQRRTDAEAEGAGAPTASGPDVEAAGRAAGPAGEDGAGAGAGASTGATVAGDGDGDRVGSVGPSATAGGVASEPAGPSVDVDELAIPGYDSLSASQVVPRLDSLTGDELELVRRYEVGNRGRKTILSKIAQLQAV